MGTLELHTDVSFLIKDARYEKLIVIQGRWEKIGCYPAISCDLRSYDEGRIGRGEEECDFGDLFWTTQALERRKTSNRCFLSLNNFWRVICTSTNNGGIRRPGGDYVHTNAAPDEFGGKRTCQ